MDAVKPSADSVFGSWKIDGIIFFLPVVLSFLIVGVMNYASLSVYPVWYNPIFIILFDSPHIIASYWVILRKDVENTQLKLRLAVMFLLVYALFFTLIQIEQDDFCSTFIALFSLWHFIRQHQTWFYISMRRDSRGSGWDRWINHIGIGVVTWGFFLAGQSGGDREGWFFINDIFLLPSWLRTPLLVGCAISCVVYVVHHVRKAIQTQEFNLSGQLIWLSAIAVWGGTRVLDVGYLAAPLVVMTHSISYLYLLGRYESNTKNHWASDWPLMGLYLASFVGVLYACWHYYRVHVEGIKDYPIWGTAFILTLTLCHYLNDKLFWNSKNNPSWHSRGMSN